MTSPSGPQGPDESEPGNRHQAPDPALPEGNLPAADGSYPPGAYPPAGAYPQPGAHLQPGTYPDPNAYPPPASFGQQGNYPPQGSYPAPGAYPPQGAYPQQAAYPPPPAGYQPQAGYQVPPGAPAPDGSAGYPPGYPPPGFPPPGFPGSDPLPPRKKRLWLKILVPVLVVLVGLGVGAYIYNKNTATQAASVGDCIEVKTATATDSKTNQIDCSDSRANFLLVGKGPTEKSCDENELALSLTRGGKIESVLCMRENAKVGDCIDFTETPLVRKVDCATAVGSDRVGKVLLVDTTTSDPARCPEDSIDATGYVTRNTLICYGAVE